MEARLFDEMSAVQADHWWYHGRRAIVGSVLERHLPDAPVRRVLDVGCGTGGMLPALRPFGRLEALEASERALELCRSRFGDDVRLHRGQLPSGVPDRDAFDLVTAFDVLEHIPDADLPGSLAAIRSALKPDGRFVCTVPAFDFLWSEHDVAHGHQRRYTRPRLVAELEGAGLQVLWTSYFNSFLFPPIALVRLAGKLLPRRGDGSQLSAVPPLVNGALARLFSLEQHLVPRWSLPFGVSLLAVARRPAAA